MVGHETVVVDDDFMLGRSCTQTIFENSDGFFVDFEKKLPFIGSPADMQQSTFAHLFGSSLKNQGFLFEVLWFPVLVLHKDDSLFQGAVVP